VGLSAFLAECQHQVEAPAAGMFDHVEFRHCAWKEVPDLVGIVVWVDPAVTDTDQSDAHGIQADGVAGDGTVYRLWSWEARTSPEESLRRALLPEASVQLPRSPRPERLPQCNLLTTVTPARDEPLPHNIYGSAWASVAHRAVRVGAGYRVRR